jgi:hypothetical protein
LEDASVPGMHPRHYDWMTIAGYATLILSVLALVIIFVS